MSSINTVAIVGRLTRDPELRSTNSGMSVCDLGVAVNEREKDRDGNWDDRANFFDVTVWGGQAEAVAEHMSKGREIGIAGRLRYESWEKDGQKRSKVKIVAHTVQFLGGKGDGGNGNGGGGSVPADTTDLPTGGADLPGGTDDIPF